jgi:hypothetical protein
MSAVLGVPPYLQFFDADGNPLAGGTITTYAAGTTTPKATYTDSTGNTAADNPIELDSSGIPDTANGSMWLIGSYKFVVKDSLGNTIRTTDNVTAFTTLAEANDAYFQTFSGDGTTTAFTTSTSLGTEEKGLDIEIYTGLQALIANGTFATDTIWTKGAGWTIAAGVATATGAISTAISQTAAFTVVAGQAYSVTYTITRSAGGLIPSVGGTAGVERTASGTYNEVIVAGSTQTLAWTGNAFTGTLDNVSVNLVTAGGWAPINPNAYTINGTALTFASAPPIGTNNIQVRAPSLLLGAASAAAGAAEASATAALASQVAAAASAAAALVSQNSATSSASTATTQAGNASTSATTATTQATTATTQAGIAATQATNAAASAVLAGSTFTATSVTSNSISIASKSFTTQTNKNFQAGQFMTVVDSASNANYMFGRVTSYDNGTGALVFDSQTIGGSGTKTSWNISVSATTLSAGGSGFGLGAYRTNAYNAGFLNSIANLTASLAANTLYAVPFIVTDTTTFTRIGINVTTLSTGSARLGIYNFANAAPTTLVSDCGTVAVTGTGEKEITISQSLAAGAYALVVLCDGTPIVRRGGTNSSNPSIFGFTDSAGTQATHITQAMTYAALNASFGTPTYVDSSATTPAIWLRKV